MPFRSSRSPLPLTPLSFEILLALIDEPQHGYAVLQLVGSLVDRLLPLRTGTVYRALARLMDEALIERTGPPKGDGRRRVYRITRVGRDIARAEALRLADQVAAARARRLLPGSKR